MKRNNNYETMLEATEQLMLRGYTGNFSINQDGLLTEGVDIAVYGPNDVELHEFHRFEGYTNPSDLSILYAVETKSGEKGLVVDSFGVYGSEHISAFMNNVSQKQFDEE
jgi:hypothetical protein